MTIISKPSQWRLHFWQLNVCYNPLPNQTTKTIIYPQTATRRFLKKKRPSKARKTDLRKHENARTLKPAKQRGCVHSAVVEAIADITVTTKQKYKLPQQQKRFNINIVIAIVWHIGYASGIASSIARSSCTYSQRNKIITVAIIIGAPSKPKTPPDVRQDNSSLISSVRVTIHIIWTYTTDHENVHNFEMIFRTNSIFTTVKPKSYGKRDYKNTLSGTRNIPQEKKERELRRNFDSVVALQTDTTKTAFTSFRDGIHWWELRHWSTKRDADCTTP